ncbi:MAG TPA: hypothetical protein VMA73_27875 [Streptosporangiaceae bacterium]|nr:hypothetical protein [Streptosporangiaceae bacterium]
MGQSSAAPEAAQREPKRLWQRSVDLGVATIVSATVTGLFTLTGIGLTFWLTRPPTSTSTARSKGPVTLTINHPASGEVAFKDSYSGKVSGLQPGQTIWLFEQGVSKTGVVGASTFPEQGPCNVNLSAGTWNCSDIYVGNPKDTGSFKMCAAILTPDEAYDVVGLLSNLYASRQSGYIYWFVAPPPYIHEQSGACMSAVRVNG